LKRYHREGMMEAKEAKCRDLDNNLHSWYHENEIDGRCALYKILHEEDPEFVANELLLMEDDMMLLGRNRLYANPPMEARTNFINEALTYFGSQCEAISADKALELFNKFLQQVFITDENKKIYNVLHLKKSGDIDYYQQHSTAEFAGENVGAYKIENLI